MTHLAIVTTALYDKWNAKWNGEKKMGCHSFCGDGDELEKK